jgi:hypothetical protein
MSYLQRAREIAGELAKRRTEEAVSRASRLEAGSPLFASTVNAILAMPLSTFRRDGAALELRVPWWPETLWFVPNELVAKRLYAEGIGRHRLWTAHELDVLLQAAPVGDVALKTLVAVRQSFEGDIIGLRFREEGD